MIYEPAEDSFLLGKFLAERCKGKSVLDVGCGSGYLGKEALKNGAKSVDCVDIDSEAVEYCKSKGLNAFQSDLFSKVTKKYDLIVFNPPYLPEDKREDAESAGMTTGGKKGFEILVRFLKQVKEHLNYKGEVLLVVSSLTGNVEELFKGFEFWALGSKKIFFEELRVYSLR